MVLSAVAQAEPPSAVLLRPVAREVLPAARLVAPLALAPLPSAIAFEPLASALLPAASAFAPLAAAANRAGAVASRPVRQGDWLLSLGAAQRAERLTAAGDAGATAALRRLTHPDEMGHLFKAMAIWPKGAPPVPGFDALRLHADHA